MAIPTFSRKQFIQTSAMAATGLAYPLSQGKGLVFPSGFFKTEQTKFRLKNVLLETGFEYEGDEVIATKTNLFTLEIAEGKIKEILTNDPGDTSAINAKGYLLLPSFRDMHTHIDKTYYGGKWKATARRQNGVKAMIELEKKILPDLLKNSTYKAEKAMELLQSKGTGFIRNQTNIEPTSGLRSLDNFEKALENKKDSISAEIVLFPQHGVFYTDTAPLLKEAAKREIVDFIGGVDPYSIDGNIEKTVDFTVQLALDHGKGIDMHLHETDQWGLKTVEYLIDKVLENPQLKGKTWLSHCFVLGSIDRKKQEELAEKLATSKIGINSTIPFGGLVMPIPLLYEKGVKVATGNDSLVDHWSSFGTGSVLYKTNLAAQLYGYRTEFELSRILRLATGNLLPLDDRGNRQWPQKGATADMVLVDASCSAETVARMSPIKSLIHQGRIVF